MLRSFESQKDLDIEALIAFNDELRGILLDIDSGEIFATSRYSEDEFQELLASFVANQRDSLGRTKPGSWSIVPDDRGMDSDARVEFIFTPTYLVTAIMTRVLCDYPSLTEHIPNYKEALKRGMLFCSYRRLYGHGYDALKGAAEALTILSMGKIPQVLEQERQLCPELYRSIVEVTKEMENSLSEGSASGMWGESLQGEFSSSLETLYIMNDKKTMEAIANIGEDSELLSEEDLPW